MKNWKTILIIVLVVAALIAAYYLFIHKKKAPAQEQVLPEHTTTQEQPAAVQQPAPTQPVIDTTQPSLKVTYLETQEAPTPTASALANLLLTPHVQNAPPFIHHMTGTTSACRNYIRYKNGYYRLISSKLDEQGYKVCYYKTIALQ